MGRDLYDHSRAAKLVLDRIAAMEGLEQIPDLCFEGPDSLLTRTDNVQPAITAISLMATAAFREAFEGIEPVGCAGHSLGEYAAHAAAGNLSEEQVMQLVRWRGFWMNKASQPPHPSGAMVAVMGLSLEKLESIVEKIGKRQLAIANINSRNQIILSGERNAVEDATEVATQHGAKRCVKLNVSGAWHSPLMHLAHQEMAELLTTEITDDKVSVSQTTPVVANATGDIVDNPDTLRDTLIEQIISPVRWEECIRRLMQAVGYPDLPSDMTLDEYKKITSSPLFIEMGPGKVLNGLLRGIDRKLDVVNVEDMMSLQNLKKTIE